MRHLTKLFKSECVKARESSELGVEPATILGTFIQHGGAALLATLDYLRVIIGVTK